MTARERAEEALSGRLIASTPIYRRFIVEAVEQAIIVAEEEAAKREREAFLQIVKTEEEYGERNQINEYACCARAIEGKIKARSEGEKKEKGE